MSESGHIFLFRKTDDTAWLDARRLKFMKFYSCVGLRDPAGMHAIDQVVATPDMQSIRWLRLDAHEQGPECWLHRENWCICREDGRQST